MSSESAPNVLLYRAKDQIEASLLLSMLEHSGIRAWTAGGQAGLAFGELPADALLVGLRVFEADHARAHTLIEEYFKRPAESDDQPVAWTCADCGETVEGSFSSCWSCGAQKTPENG